MYKPGDRREADGARLAVDMTAFMMWSAMIAFSILFWSCLAGAVIKYFWLGWVLR